MCVYACVCVYVYVCMCMYVYVCVCVLPVCLSNRNPNPVVQKQ